MGVGATAREVACGDGAQAPAREDSGVSGGIDFAADTALPDWPLAEETGVGFCQDETLALGIADRPILRDE